METKAKTKALRAVRRESRAVRRESSRRDKRSHWWSNGYAQALLALAVATVAVIAIALASPASHIEGEAAPPFKLPSLTNPSLTVAFTAHEHEPVVLTFFASWCGPCRKELPVLARVANEVAGSAAGSARFIGVDVEDSRTGGEQLVSTTGVAYPVGSDPSGRVADGLYRLVGLPATIFISADGHIVHVHRGAISRATALSWIKRASQTARSVPTG